jgi:protein subunit release factor B
VTFEVSGDHAYGYLRGEKGVHRLVRISPFDSQARRHTSFSSLDVAPMLDDIDEAIEINMNEVRVDTYHSSGAGGQNVNKTSSAVRMTHYPTGIVVACQTERDQVQNRATCIAMLKSKLLELRIRAREEEMAEIKGEMKKIEWGSQIRSYVFQPYTMVKDHRTSFESGNIDDVMNGNIKGFVNYVDQYLDSIKAQNPDALLCTFIANHDTDRAAGFLTVDFGHAHMGANLSILTPGSPFIYYGEEIGARGSRGSNNTDANRRLGMMWGDGDTVKDPTGANYTAGQTNGTVLEHLPNGDSLYNHYKKLIMIRKAHPEIAYGDFTPLIIEGTKAAGFISTYNGSTVVVIHNATTEAVIIDLSQLTDVNLTVLSAYAGRGDVTLEGTTLTIAAQTSVVLK